MVFIGAEQRIEGSRLLLKESFSKFKFLLLFL